MYVQGMLRKGSLGISWGKHLGIFCDNLGTPWGFLEDAKIVQKIHYPKDPQGVLKVSPRAPRMDSLQRLAQQKYATAVILTTPGD